jgi:hypothetical protein
MTSELGHLLPELRHEATLCNEERIRRIQLDRWISYPKADTKQFHRGAEPWQPCSSSATKPLNLCSRLPSSIGGPTATEPRPSRHPLPSHSCEHARGFPRTGDCCMNDDNYFPGFASEGLKGLNRNRSFKATGLTCFVLCW